MSTNYFSSNKIANNVLADKGRILVVDDEPLVLEIIEAALLEDGYEVVCAPNSKSALKQIERTNFDAIVCDIRLEDLDGFDLLVLSRKKNPSVAAVLMTGSPCEEDMLRANELEARYLSKPIVIAQLLKTVEQTISNSQTEMERVLAA